MLNEPLISVILPTYNRKNIVGRAISSVIRQSHDNWELIIVDDGADGVFVIPMHVQEVYMKH